MEREISNYEEKLKKEKQWYMYSAFRTDHFLNSKLFYSPERHLFNYAFLKQQMSSFIDRMIIYNNFDQSRILIAPIGTGDDIQYLQHISDDISGIDISKEAISKISNKMVKKYVGDMKNMNMFSDNYFDIVVVPGFFHHFTKFGFDDFLREAHRVLKPGGLFFSSEPSSLYPLSWATWVGKKIFGNITGLVEDEAPFVPFKLSNAMKKCGFRDVKIVAASFSHNRVPIWLAKINNAITAPLLRFPILKYFAWMCLFYGKK